MLIKLCVQTGGSTTPLCAHMYAAHKHTLLSQKHLNIHIYTSFAVILSVRQPKTSQCLGPFISLPSFLLSIHFTFLICLFLDVPFLLSLCFQFLSYPLYSHFFLTSFSLSLLSFRPFLPSLFCFSIFSIFPRFFLAPPSSFFFSSPPFPRSFLSKHSNFVSRHPFFP